MKSDNSNKIELKELNEIIFHGAPVTITSQQQKAIDDSYNFLAAFSRDKVIYGINTGFGPMAQYRIDNDSLTALQYNIIRSHSTGAGEPLATPYVKAAMVARLYTFLQGKSGVHRELTDLLVQFINHDIYPFIPEHGSVGASGDLVQLAHMALALIGEGDVFYHGKKRPTSEVLEELGLQPFKMHIREGLSVSNGTSVMTGIGIVNLIYAKKLLHWATVAAVLMNEIASSYDDFQSEELNATKLHRGQRTVAAAMRNISHNSHCLRNRQAELYDQRHEEKIFEHKVQPYYSLRCVPQVLGPVFDTLANCEQVLIDEVNSACDNPIVDADNNTVYHGGNFMATTYLLRWTNSRLPLQNSPCCARDKPTIFSTTASTVYCHPLSTWAHWVSTTDCKLRNSLPHRPQPSARLWQTPCMYTAYPTITTTRI